MQTMPSSGIRSAEAAIRSSPLLKALGHAESAPRLPFLTISRQAGAGGHTIGQRLVEKLNEVDPAEQPWALWDKDLVEKVLSESHLEREMVESLGESHQSWMQEFLSGLSAVGDTSEAKVYQRVATTIRALAAMGRVAIVGRGGVYVTRHMPGGIHLRLVAPFENRVCFMARQFQLSHDDAVVRVHELDRQRNAFYHRYWPSEVLSAESFTLTINTAVADEEWAVQSVIPLILRKSQAMVAGLSTNIIGVVGR